MNEYLRRDARHHAQRGDVGQSGEDLRHASTVHLEPLDRPVALETRAGLNTGSYSKLCGKVTKSRLKVSIDMI